MSLPTPSARRWLPRLEIDRRPRSEREAHRDETTPASREAAARTPRRRVWSDPFSGMSIRWRLTLAYSFMLFTMLSSFSLGIYWFVGNRRMDELVQESEARAVQVSTDLNQARNSMAQLQDLAGIFSAGPLVTQMLYESRIIDKVFNPFVAPGAGLRIFDRKHNLIFPPEQPNPDMVSDMATLPNREQVLSTVPNRLAIVMALRGGRHREVVTGVAGDQVLVYTVPMYQQNPALAHPAGLGSQNEVVGAIQVLTSLKPYNDTLDVVQRILVLGTLFATALAALTGAALAQTAIAPLHRIANTAARINRAQDLGRRIAVDCPRDELGHLAVTINDMLDRIEGMFDRQRTFLADVSHELRTPLTTIRGEVELMQRTGHVDDEALTAVRGESERMSRMIDDLLLLARADTESHATGKHSPVPLDQLVMDVFHQGQMMARSNGGHQIVLGNADALTVSGDRDRLKQLLLNLVANAFRHTPSGTTVTLELFREDDEARLIVRDDGPGIPADDVPHIFERFYRVDKARTRSSGGTGLGLAIVRSIARAHGGDVTLACPASGGTSFTVTLPTDDETAPSWSL
jgi:heavy metal sensor kinase